MDQSSRVDGHAAAAAGTAVLAFCRCNSCFRRTAADRPLLWIDACEGEPAEYAQVVEDLGKARVVYLGERHTLQRHHDTQARLIADLAQRRRPSLVVALEPLEASQQPSIDRFNRGEIDFDGLAAAIDWAKRWPSYQQYRPVLEAARKAKAPVIGLSPSPEVIRAVVRSGGVDRLDAKLRKQLPAEMDFKDPVYEKLLAAQLMVHMAASPERLRPMIEAQIARDEAMSAALADYLRSDSRPRSQGGRRLRLGTRRLRSWHAAAGPPPLGRCRTTASSCWPSAATFACPPRKRPPPGRWKSPTSSGGKSDARWPITWRSPARAGSEGPCYASAACCPNENVRASNPRYRCRASQKSQPT